MFNYNNVYSNNYKRPVDLEALYPEVYKELFPLVIEAANNFSRKGTELTAEELGLIIDNIIRQAGMWDEDDDAGVNPSSAHTNQQPFRRFRRRHHNRNSLRDVLRILFLRELIH